MKFKEKISLGSLLMRPPATTMKRPNQTKAGLASLLLVCMSLSNASAALVVGVNGVVLNPDNGGFTGSNQTIQDWQGSSEASAWYNGSGLASALNEGDTVPGTLPFHQYGQNFAGNVDFPSFQSARLRSGSAPFDADTTVTFSLVNVTDGLNGLLIWNATESSATVGDRNSRGFASATAEFSTNGTTWFGSESLSFSAGPTTNVNGDYTVAGQSVSFSNTYDDVKFVRFSDISNFNGALETDQSLAGIAEIRFTAVPEPSAAFLGLLGTLGLLRRRR
jgi:hypothetical protein